MKIRRRKTARERRAQRARAEARTVSRLLGGLAELHSHRGSMLSRAGAILQRSLQRSEGEPSVAPRLVPSPCDVPLPRWVLGVGTRSSDDDAVDASSVPSAPVDGDEGLGAFVDEEFVEWIRVTAQLSLRRYEIRRPRDAAFSPAAPVDPMALVTDRLSTVAETVERLERNAEVTAALFPTSGMFR